MWSTDRLAGSLASPEMLGHDTDSSLDGLGGVEADVLPEGTADQLDTDWAVIGQGRRNCRRRQAEIVHGHESCVAAQDFGGTSPYSMRPRWGQTAPLGTLG